MSLAVEVTGGSAIEHRLELLEGATAALAEVAGGVAADPPRDIGRTRAIVVTPDAAGGGAYTLRYRVTQAATRAHRCPLWLPAAPTDGRGSVVRIAVTVPAGTTGRGGMPAFTWQGRQGEAALAHLPAFVTVPFGPPTEARAWDVARVMDAAALGTLAAASLLWAVRRKGGR